MWAVASLRLMNLDGVPHADSYTTLRQAGLSVREIMHVRRIVASEAKPMELPVFQEVLPIDQEEVLDLHLVADVREELLEMAASEGSRKLLRCLSPKQRPQLLADWGLSRDEAQEALRRMDEATSFLSSLRSRL